MEQSKVTTEKDDSDWFGLEMEATRAFSPASPIDEKSLFADRIEPRRRVLDALFQRGQSIIIFGERGVGKTSLANVLHQFLRDLEKDVSILAPKVSCTAEDSFSTLWRRIFSGIYITQTSTPVSFSTIQARLQSSKTVAEMLPERISPDEVCKTLRYLSDNGQKVVSIFDEFDRLEDEDAKRLFADTIKMMSDYPSTAKIVLVGVADSIDQLQMGHPSVERALVQVHMPRMTNEELLEIVDKGVRSLKMSIDEAVRGQIVSLSKGLPHYTHLLAMHTVRAAISAKSMEINQEHFALGIKAALDSCQQSIKSAYHQATTTPRKESRYPQVLLACALAQPDSMGYFAPADVREPLSAIMGRTYDIPAFARHLVDFSEKLRGPILQRTGSARRYRFRFINPLMQPYVVMKGYDNGLIKRKE